MKYSQSGAISAVLIEKSNAEQLISNHSNILIRAAKAVDGGVTALVATKSTRNITRKISWRGENESSLQRD